MDINVIQIDTFKSLFLTFPTRGFREGCGSFRKEMKNKWIFKYVVTPVQGLKLANGNILRTIFTIFTSLDKVLAQSKS